MPLTPPVVITAFRMILGRDPGGRAVVDEHLARFDTLQALREYLMRTPEFMRHHAELISQSRNPGLDLAVEKLVLMHIPKTAGTTLIGILDHHFKPAQIFPDQLQLRGYPAQHLGRFRLFRGHFPLRDVQYIPGQKFVFTMLREPRARILSQYHYHKARKIDASLRGTLVEKARLPLKKYLADPEVRANAGIDNIHTRYLFYLDPPAVRLLGLRQPDGSDFHFADRRQDVLAIARANLARLGGFGLVERFDESVLLLAAARGFPAPDEQAPRMVTSKLAEIDPTTYAPVQIDPPDAETNALLDELVALDEAVYADAASLFEARLRAHRRQPADALVSAG